MKNLYLDQTAHDLAVNSKYNLRLTRNDTEYVSQKIENKLRTFYAEWFADQTIGVPYLQRVFGKIVDVNEINSLLLSELNNIEEIKEVLKFDISYNNTIRRYSIDLEVQIYTGEVIPAGFSIGLEQQVR